MAFLSPQGFIATRLSGAPSGSGRNSRKYRYDITMPRFASLSNDRNGPSPDWRLLATLAKLPELSQFPELPQLVQRMEQFLKAADFAGVTRLLIVQPTAFCHVDCDYCYLPHRGDRRVMSHETVAAAARFIFEANLQARDFTVVWHAGEPLVVPPDWYAEAFARVAAEAPAGSSVPHAIQTNGMLINDAWCDLFLAHDVRVGVSIDGPAFLHDARRRTRSGGGTHAKTLRGLRLLKSRGVALHLICVITNASLGHGRKLMEFSATRASRTSASTSRRSRARMPARAWRARGSSTTSARSSRPCLSSPTRRRPCSVYANIETSWRCCAIQDWAACRRIRRTCPLRW